MPRINNKKLLCREAGEEYTAAEYEEIRRTQLLLWDAEIALRNANLLWKEIITPPGPVVIFQKVLDIELDNDRYTLEDLPKMVAVMIKHLKDKDTRRPT